MSRPSADLQDGPYCLPADVREPYEPNTCVSKEDRDKALDTTGDGTISSTMSTPVGPTGRPGSDSVSADIITTRLDDSGSPPVTIIKVTTVSNGQTIVRSMTSSRSGSATASTRPSSGTLVTSPSIWLCSTVFLIAMTLGVHNALAA